MKERQNIVLTLTWFFLIASIILTILVLFINDQNQKAFLWKINIYCYIGFGISVIVYTIQKIMSQIESNHKRLKEIERINSKEH